VPPKSSSVLLEGVIKIFDGDDLEEAERNNAIGFNNFDAAKEK